MTTPSASAGPHLLGPADVRVLAEQHGIVPTKQRGQNFVIDPNTVRRIVRAADLSPDDVVLEIGPGLGSLTLGLLGSARQVAAVEVDARLVGALPTTISTYAPERAGRLCVLHLDALDLTPDAVPEPPSTLVANLPYNVAVPVLLHLLATFDGLHRGLVMVQREVADRLTAGPGSRTYGVPSVKLAWYADVRRAGVIGRRVFWPAPRVDSALVSLTRRPAPSTAASREQVFAVIETAFGQRRKTLRAALAGRYDPAAVREALVQAEVDPAVRPERLGVADFARVAAALTP